MNRRLVIIAIILLGLAFPGAALASLAADRAAVSGSPGPPAYELDPGRLHPALLKSLSEGAPGDSLRILVEVEQPPDWIRSFDLPDGKEAARETLVAALQARAETRAAPILDLARMYGEAGETARVFWIAPVVGLTAGPELIAALARLPGVVQIRLDAPIHVPGINLQPAGGPTRSMSGLPWNLALIRLDLVQPGLGLDGDGIVVANLDSGVDWTHPALQEQYRGSVPGQPPVHTGNWYVATGENYPAPVDLLGHGTHTMGTMVGDDGAGRRTGVAPGARWIAVKMIGNGGYFLESWAHDAFQWIMAPAGQPGLAPDIVSCSWGSGFPSDERFRADIQALRAGGILPIFSAGNGGPFDSTVSSPADYPETFAVGATDDAGIITTFSARGPSLPPWSETKPEIVAPGADISSTVPGGGYFLADGTSMAAPHAAGVAALLLQANPSLTPDQLESILVQSAHPMPPTPNNNTGWGMLDAYAAAVAVTPHGEVWGQVRSEAGVGLPYPVVTATHSSGSPRIVRSGGASGAFRIPLAPGVYEIEVSAFGYERKSLGPVQVHTGMEIERNASLVRLPYTSIMGKVVEKGTGAPLQASVHVEGTPYTVEAGMSGQFSLELHAGTWDLVVISKGHRIARATITTGIGPPRLIEFELDPAPTILLVDSGRWYYSSQAPYYTGMLDALDYAHDLYEVRDPFGINTGIDDAPQLADLAPYDLVIWTAPSDSPGLINAGKVISEYLSTGGKLLVTGQDVAYWDGGGSLFVLPSYFPAYTGAWFETEGEQINALGAAGSRFEELDLTMNTPDSAGGQSAPDTVTIVDPFAASLAYVWPGGGTAGLLSGTCEPHRLAWTGFGLEGSGPGNTRQAVFDHLLNFLAEPPPKLGLALPAAQPVLIGEAGETLTHNIEIFNRGTNTETFLLELTPGQWPVGGILPGGEPFSTEAEVVIPACSSRAMQAEVTIPETMPMDVFDVLVLKVESTSDPGIAAEISMKTKTHAPVLLLDDGLWVWYGERYAAALDVMGVSYDYVNTNGETLLSNILMKYPLVIWTTGQDWFYSIQVGERRMMQDYLLSGGRLLLTSQDFLNSSGASFFAKSFLGVSSYSLEITPTLGIRDPQNPAGGAADLLAYPFVNWSDSFSMEGGVQVRMVDQRRNVIGAANIPSLAPGGRVVFYSFPLETLPPDSLLKTLMRDTLWLGPFGETRLKLPEDAAAGDRIPLELRLESAGEAPIHGASAQVELPAAVSVRVEDLSGGWIYHPPEHTLNWSGSLSPGAGIPLNAVLDLDPDLASGTSLQVRTTLRTGDGQLFTDQREIRIGVSNLTLKFDVAPGSLSIESPAAAFTLTVTNTGYGQASAEMTATLPAGLQIVPGSIVASSGLASELAGRIHWFGFVAPGEAVVLTYQAAADLTRPPGTFLTAAVVWDGAERRAAWAEVNSQGALFFPLIVR